MIRYRFQERNFGRDQDIYAVYGKKCNAKEKWERENPELNPLECPIELGPKPNDVNPYDARKWVPHALNEADCVEIGMSYKEHKKHGNIIQIMFIRSNNAVVIC